jgi:hypothetical protein
MDDPRVTFQSILDLLEHVFPDHNHEHELFESYLRMTTRFLSNLIPAGSLTISASRAQTTLSPAQQARNSGLPLAQLKYTPQRVTNGIGLLQSPLLSSAELDFQQAGGSRL